MPYILLHCIGLLALTPAEEWRREIEQRHNTRISLIRVEFDVAKNEMRLAGNGDEQATARTYLSDPAFRAQFAAAHALTVNLPDRHLIFINLGHARQWNAAEDGLLAHEIGHIWLDRLGLRSPPFEHGPDACLAIQAGDIPQHMLIRAETARRGLPWREYLTGNLRAALASLESAAAAPELTLCQKAVLVSQWLDLRLGVTETDFDGYHRLNQLYADRFPDALPVTGALESYLLQTNLNGPEAFASAVRRVREQLEKLKRGE